jgi:hypothetical protein
MLAIYGMSVTGIGSQVDGMIGIMKQGLCFNFLSIFQWVLIKQSESMKHIFG